MRIEALLERVKNEGNGMIMAEDELVVTGWSGSEYIGTAKLHILCKFSAWDKEWPEKYSYEGVMYRFEEQTFMSTNELGEYAGAAEYMQVVK